MIEVSRSQENHAIVALNLNSKEVKCPVHLSHVKLEDRSLEDQQDWKRKPKPSSSRQGGLRRVFCSSTR